jgi:transposase
MKRITIQNHLSLEEIQECERQADTVIERLHWQTIRLIGQGKRTAEVAGVTGYSEGWVRALIRRYNEQGPGVVGDGRRHNPGHARLLTAEQETALRHEVEQGIAAGEVWTGVMVAQRMSELRGQPVHRTRGWELLKRWGFRQRKPRPRHVKAAEEMQELFKKRSYPFS